jgi:hypothetical protein
VIGTFIAAGVVFATLAGVVVCLVRRHRRNVRRRRLEAILPTNPFDDLAAANAPIMVQHVPINHDYAGYDERSPGVRQPEQAHVYSDVGMSSPVADQTTYYEGPFSDYHSPRRDSFYGSGEEGVLDIRPPSRQLSTPSIYPPSISESDEDSLYQKEARASLPPLRPTSASEYIALERVSGHPSLQETQLQALNQQHPPLAPDAPSFERTISSMSHDYASSSQGHGSIHTPVTPTSESGTLVALEENVKGHPMLPSPPSAFLRRQLSKRAPSAVSPYLSSQRTLRVDAHATRQAIVAPPTHMHIHQPSVDSMAAAGTAL